MTLHFPTVDQWFAILAILVSLAIVVERFTEGLKKVEALSDKNAGTINAVLSFIIAAAGFIFTYFSRNSQFLDAQASGAAAAVAIVSFYSISLLAWLLHQGMELIHGKKPDVPTATLSVATIETGALPKSI